MQVIKNDRIKLKLIKQSIDDLDPDLEKIEEPLPKKSMAMYIVGCPGSGKTSLLLSLLLSKTAYLKKFDKVYLMSGSLQTLPPELLSNLPPDQTFDEFDIEKVYEIIKEERDSALNNNILFIFDDVVKDIQERSFNKLILNRRHIIQNAKNPKVKSGTSIWLTSQTYNLLNLKIRKNINTIILFPTANRKELQCIKDELMMDLDDKEQDAILKYAWSKPYGFLFIRMDKPKTMKYYSNFDLIKL
jgi:GTPase SAR1 family protein